MVEHLVAEFTQHTTEILSDAYLFTVCSFHSIQKMLIVQSAVLHGKNGEGAAPCSSFTDPCVRGSPLGKQPRRSGLVLSSINRKSCLFLWSDTELLITKFPLLFAWFTALSRRGLPFPHLYDLEKER